MNKEVIEKYPKLYEACSKYPEITLSTPNSNNSKKIKVSELTIITEKHGANKSKTYYEIKYFTSNEWHIGFGSYNLDIVLGYIKEYFDFEELT
jgi:hypothetical protein